MATPSDMNAMLDLSWLVRRTLHARTTPGAHKCLLAMVGPLMQTMKEKYTQYSVEAGTPKHCNKIEKLRTISVIR